MSNPQITTLDTQQQPPKAVVPKRVASAGSGHDVALSGRKATITIHANESAGGSDDVPVGINGFMYMIRRGEPVEVPFEVLDVLQNAISQHLSNGKGSEVIVKDIPRFAYTVHSMDPAKKAA